MSTYTIEGFTPVNITGTAVVASVGVVMAGFYCNSTTGGTIVFRNGSAASGTVLNGAITPTAGLFHRFPAICGAGLHATIANTLDVTIFFQGV